MLASSRAGLAAGPIVAAVQASLLLLSCGGGDEWPPSRCPIVGTEESSDSVRAMVQRYRADLTAESREEPWATEKETELSTQLPRAEGLKNSRVLIDAVECKTSLCELSLIYRTDEAGPDEAIESITDYLLVEEKCGFFWPGILVEIGCGEFEQTLFINCQSRR